MTDTTVPLTALRRALTALAVAGPLCSVPALGTAQTLPACGSGGGLPCERPNGKVIETQDVLDRWIGNNPERAEAARGAVDALTGAAQEVQQEAEAALSSGAEEAAQTMQETQESVAEAAENVVAEALPDCVAGGAVPCTRPDGAVIDTPERLDRWTQNNPDRAQAAAGAAGAASGAADDASDRQAEAQALPDCGAGIGLPCLRPDGAVIDTQERLDRWMENNPDRAQAAAGAAGAAPQADAEESAAATAQEGGDGPSDREQRLRERLDESREARQAAEERAATAEADRAEAERQAREARRAARRAEAQAAQADATGEVQEGVVQQRRRRATEDVRPIVVDNDDNDDDDAGDLTDLQQALIAGVGAAAVGAIIDNVTGQIVQRDPGRAVVMQDGTYNLVKYDDALLADAGNTFRTERFADGSTRNTITREDGSDVVTVVAADGTVLRRERILPDGRRLVLFDDTQPVQPVEVSQLPRPADRGASVFDAADEAALRQALTRQILNDPDRSFSLSQVRSIEEVRALAPEVELTGIRFPTGSAAISEDQIPNLAALGRAVEDILDEDPSEVFLIEGHTDAVGDAASNLALSDRRAESLALVLTEYFDVPPENLVVQGYGESDLRVETEAAEQANRRAVVRRITPLLQASAG